MLCMAQTRYIGLNLLDPCVFRSRLHFVTIQSTKAATQRRRGRYAQGAAKNVWDDIKDRYDSINKWLKKST